MHCQTRMCGIACVVTCPAVCVQLGCVCNVVGGHQAQALDVVQVADLRGAWSDQPPDSHAKGREDVYSLLLADHIKWSVLWPDRAVQVMQVMPTY